MAPGPHRRAGDNTKSRYAFVYGDFRRLHRMGLIACQYRAAEWRHRRSSSPPTTSSSTSTGAAAEPFVGRGAFERPPAAFVADG